MEAEIQLLTAEEAEKSPAGLGREAPDPLPEPKYVPFIYHHVVYCVAIEHQSIYVYIAYST